MWEYYRQESLEWHPHLRENSTQVLKIDSYKNIQATIRRVDDEKIWNFFIIWKNTSIATITTQAMEEEKTLWNKSHLLEITS